MYNMALYIGGFIIVKYQVESCTGQVERCKSNSYNSKFKIGALTRLVGNRILQTALAYLYIKNLMQLYIYFWSKQYVKFQTDI
jgi:hypothetical protein